jgi:hypothetical protein
MKFPSPVGEIIKVEWKNILKNGAFFFVRDSFSYCFRIAFYKGAIDVALVFLLIFLLYNYY